MRIGVGHTTSVLTRAKFEGGARFDGGSDLDQANGFGRLKLNGPFLIGVGALLTRFNGLLTCSKMLGSNRDLPAE